MTTTMPVHTLIGVPVTRDDIIALGTADGVSFHHGPDGAEIRGYLRTYGGSLRIYTAREQKLFPRTGNVDGERMSVLPVGSKMTGFNDGGGMWRGEDHPQARAFHTIGSARYDDDWRTVLDLLKTDDVLELHWRADNNTDITRNAGLHIDELRLLVHRNGGKHAEHGKGRTLSLLLDVSTGRDNSARMIRRHGLRQGY